VSSTWEFPPDVLALVNAEPVPADDEPGLGGWLQRLCRAAAKALPASAAGISMMSGGGEATTIAASTQHAEILEALQFTMGEGPCQDAYALGRPVLVPDLAEAAVARWPGYAPAVIELRMQAVFAFPLQLGSARVGVLDIYQEGSGSLEPAALVRALAFAALATAVLLDSVDARTSPRPAGLERMVDKLPMTAELYQAQGMVQVQLGVSLNEAMSRIRAYAYAHGRGIIEVARDIVARRLQLENDS
jgi:hypothetical protein